MKRPSSHNRAAPAGRARPASQKDLGPTQRQLRAGELVRHALVDIFREEEINDPALAGVSVTVTEVRVNPDLRHATVFVEPLGGEHADEIVKALNKHSKFIRGHLGRMIELRFTPDLHFRHDESFTEAARMARLFDDPKVRQDLTPDEPPPADSGGGNPSEDPGRTRPGGSWKDED